MKQYIELCERILANGEHRNDRTGTGTTSLFGEQLRFDLRQGFPLLTTKKVYYKAVVAELVWFLKGYTNTKWLHEHGCTIWDEWANCYGDLGRIYGAQWRTWYTCRECYENGSTIDQIKRVIGQIESNPQSRRIIVSAWNVGELEMMALPPCHCFFQFYCHEDGGLSLQLYQRSADVFLGLPFNIASYALLLEMIAFATNRVANELVITIGDAHIYDNHQEQVKEQIKRAPRELPTLRKGVTSAREQIRKWLIEAPMVGSEDMTERYILEIFSQVQGYNPHPAIKGEVAV